MIMLIVLRYRKIKHKLKKNTNYWSPAGYLKEYALPHSLLINFKSFSPNCVRSRQGQCYLQSGKAGDPGA